MKFFRLAIENNPNIIDSLFTPTTCVLHSTRVGNLVRENRRLFLHKGAWPKFKGYAYSQLHKLAIKRPQGKRAELIERHGFDTKFGYHVVRLISDVEQILVEGDIDLQRNNEQLKAIRRGEWTEARLRAWFADKESHLERLYAESTLRAVPDESRIKALLLHSPRGTLRQPGGLRRRSGPHGGRPAKHPGRARPGEGRALMQSPTMQADDRLRDEVARHPYPLVFATISGAHLYGFPSPDSDHDLRGGHVLPVHDGRRARHGPGDCRVVDHRRRVRGRSGHARRPQVFRLAAEEKRVRARAVVLALGGPNDARA